MLHASVPRASLGGEIIREYVDGINFIPGKFLYLVIKNQILLNAHDIARKGQKERCSGYLYVDPTSSNVNIV